VKSGAGGMVVVVGATEVGAVDVDSVVDEPAMVGTV